ncbi:glycosyltransferase family 2 protein [Frigidibacter sp. MR17.14]|uniref:glycosyltransferase family 2 protein n=1 Tax=Frigidibacter sp. MR17.14 TaxID=3126509 RepID=UPI0030131728
MTAPGPDLPATSLIIVSRHRAPTLQRCLTGVLQMAHPKAEIVVVADPAAAAGVRALGLPIKVLDFDIPNISQARNLGLRAAAGEVVAFLDDDAVPEPSWLARLSAPFADPAVMVAGGWVRARNGLGWQWRAGLVDRLTRTAALEVPADAVSLHPARPGRAVEVKGVNCAYRRTALLEMGGFDPELAYYLDETELNLRLAARGALSAVVPGAVVHHFKAGSRQRSARRVPVSLADVGASTAITLRRHGATLAETAARRDALIAEERAKLLRLMLRGDLEPGAVPRLLDSLRAGFAEGAARKLAPLVPLEPLPAAGALCPVPLPPRPGRVIAGRPWQARSLRRRAADAVAAGEIVTLFLFGPSARWHWSRYLPEGFWEQTGGVCGWSLREGPRLLATRFALRVNDETRKVALLRPVDPDRLRR